MFAYISRGRFLLALAAYLVLAGAARAENLKGNEVNESLTAEKSGELVRGGPAVEFEGTVVFVFKAPDKVQPGFLLPNRPRQKCYFTLKDGNLDVLTANPAVSSPAGLHVEIVSLAPKTEVVKEYARTEYVDARRSRAIYDIYDGYSVHCKVRLTARDGAQPGTHTVTVSLAGVSAWAKAHGATSPLDAPKFQFRVKVWASEAARQQALQAERAKAAGERYRVIGIILMVIDCLLALIIALKLLARCFRRLLPTYRVAVAPGASNSLTTEFTQEVSIAASKVDETPDPIVKTRQARTFWGRKADVKAEIIALPLKWQVTRWLNKRYSNGTLVDSWYTYTAKVTYMMQVTATAGADVASGGYMVHCPGGWAVVKVAPGAAAEGAANEGTSDSVKSA
jgi:hypothetical protein